MSQTRTREAWADVIKSGDYRIAELSTLINDWEEAETAADKAEEGFDSERQELEDENYKLQQKLDNLPEWGNCRRGCPPAYLDCSGFCSPACALGTPRGEFVTLPRELVIGDESKVSQ